MPFNRIEQNIAGGFRYGMVRNYFDYYTYTARLICYVSVVSGGEAGSFEIFHDEFICGAYHRQFVEYNRISSHEHI